MQKIAITAIIAFLCILGGNGLIVLIRSNSKTSVYAVSGFSSVDDLFSGVPKDLSPVPESPKLADPNQSPVAQVIPWFQYRVKIKPTVYRASWNLRKFPCYDDSCLFPERHCLPENQIIGYVESVDTFAKVVVNLDNQYLVGYVDQNALEETMSD